MSSLRQEDVLFEGAIDKKSKYNDSYKSRAAVLTKDAFYVLKKAKRFTKPLDTLPLSEVTTIQTPPIEEDEDENVLIFINKHHQYFHYKCDDRGQWIDRITKQCPDITVSTSSSLNGSASSASSPEIEENMGYTTNEENDLSVIPLELETRMYGHHRLNGGLTDSEIDISTSSPIVDFEEVDLFIIDLVHGFVRRLCEDRNASNHFNDKMDGVALEGTMGDIGNLCVMFYFVRKFDTRRLHKHFDRF